MNQENKSEGSERNGSLSQYDMDGVSSASFTDEFSRLVSYTCRASCVVDLF